MRRLLGILLCRLGYHDDEPALGTFVLNVTSRARVVRQDVVCLREGCGWQMTWERVNA
jgi:hypothetical protein